MRFLAVLLGIAAAACAAPRFRAQEIQTNFGIGYAVLTADVNRDGKPDIVAINQTQVVWFQNPAWEKHVVLDGVSRKDNVCIAAYDIDGDGRLDLALGADWPSNTVSGGSLQWIAQSSDPHAQWTMTPIFAEPTLHRIRWGDIDGDGQSELIVAPLHGRGAKGPQWDGPGARILVFRVPKNPAKDPWPMEVADESLHIVHNLIVTNMDSDRQDEIVTASREGLHVLKRAADGTWSKRRIGEGAPGEVKLGRIAGKRIFAAIEPWHGTSVVIYNEPAKTGDLWPRQAIETQLTGGHALGWGDFEGTGSDSLAVGWRDKKYGVAVYQRDAAGAWSRSVLVDEGMATEDLTVADLNGDGRPEIVAAGRATGNVRIYWNESR